MHIRVNIQISEEKPIILDDFLLQLEREIIHKALKETFLINSTAAKMLGVKRTTFIEKLKRHGFTLEKSRHLCKQEKMKRNANSRLRR